MAKTSEQEILDQCMKALKGLRGTRASVKRSGRGADAILELKGPWGMKRYAASIRNNITIESVGAIHQEAGIGQREDRLPIILMTFHVTSQVGRKLKAKDVEFVDTAGNMYLSSSPLHVEVSGKRPRDGAVSRRRSFHRNAAQLSYVILRKPESLGWTYRELAESADVALGSVGRILADLKSWGYVATGQSGEKRLVNWEKLLHRWEMAYLDVLRPRLLLGRARMQGSDIRELASAAQEPGASSLFLVGGELGASLLTNHLVPSAATLHILGSEKLVRRRLKLIPDRNGPIHLLGTWGTESGWRDGLADPLLIHAELLRDPDDRLLETASMLMEQYLIPRVSE